VGNLPQLAKHFLLNPDPDTMSIGEQKRQFALSREVIENKGRRKAIFARQSREVTENKSTYATSLISE
jgi:hypothetical protein